MRCTYHQQTLAHQSDQQLLQENQNKHVCFTVIRNIYMYNNVWIFISLVLKLGIKNAELKQAGILQPLYNWSSNSSNSPSLTAGFNYWINSVLSSQPLTLSVVPHVVFGSVQLQQAAHVQHRLELWVCQVHLLLLQHCRWLTLCMEGVRTEYLTTWWGPETCNNYLDPGPSEEETGHRNLFKVFSCQMIDTTLIFV